MHEQFTDEVDPVGAIELLPHAMATPLTQKEPAKQGTQPSLRSLEAKKQALHLHSLTDELPESENDLRGHEYTAVGEQ